MLKFSFSIAIFHSAFVVSIFREVIVVSGFTSINVLSLIFLYQETTVLVKGIESFRYTFTF